MRAPPISTRDIINDVAHGRDFIGLSTIDANAAEGRRLHFSVGKLNWAPERMPVGQRAVMVLMRV